MSVMGKIFFLALALAALPSVCVSQSTVNAASRTISGQVVNSVSGQPIARALVQMGPQFGMLTNHEGRFSFDDVPEGTGGVFASKPGYFLGEVGPAPVTPQITLQLIPEAIISGTVTDPVGRAIQDLHVQLKMLQVINGRRSWQQVQETITSVEGEYRFAELVAGKYRVVTSFQVEGLPEAESSVTFVPATYPPADGDAVNTAITLTAGDHVEANLIPADERSYPVTGVINGGVHRPVGIEAETMDGEPINAGARFYPETGAFRLLLPSGSYHLKVHAFTQTPQQLLGARDFSVDHAPLEGVSISLEPQITIPVEVDYQAVAVNKQREEANAPPSLNLTLEQADPDGPQRSVSAEPLNVRGRAQIVEPGGPLIIRNVEPGRYVMQAQVNPPWYLASASCDNLDLMRNPLVVSAGAGLCTIRVVVRNDSSTLQWSIGAGDAVRLNGSVFVSIIPLDNLTASAQSSTDSSTPVGAPLASVQFGLAPGRYLVVALPRQQEMPYRDADAMKAYMSIGQQVTLPAGGEAQVELQPSAGEP